MFLDGTFQRTCGAVLALKDNVGCHRLRADAVRIARNGDHQDRRMALNTGFHFVRVDAIAAGEDELVVAPLEKIEPLNIASRTISG